MGGDAHTLLAALARRLGIPLKVKVEDALRPAMTEAYCWLIYWSHHEDGSFGFLSCDRKGCEKCASYAAADALYDLLPTTRASA